MTDPGRAQRVLLVEDNAADATLLHRYLTRGDAAYDLTTATTGQDGLDQVRSFQPDVVLLDYELPDLNGLEFLDELRRMPDIAQPVVLAITEQSDPRIAAVRHRLAAYLAQLGFDPARVDDALLAVGEAIANAIEHAYAGSREHAYAGSREHGLFSLRAFVGNTVRVVIEVLDHGVWRQRGIDPSGALPAERGRGLMIMHALSDDVTVEHDDTGTRVRLVFAYAPAAAVAAGSLA